ncbi:hypothetical protein NFI96_017302, partial [Prochilodus magdalenae]
RQTRNGNSKAVERSGKRRALFSSKREASTGISGRDWALRVRNPRFSWTVGIEENLAELWSGEECPFNVSSPFIPRQSGKGEKVDRNCSSPRNSR